ncbi:MAG: DNA starvation/stationary phase protection protein [Legionellaceae bacterium]|nr:DNA starvation/stationary phase protection protein [Legionellaceae bacterium]
MTNSISSSLKIALADSYVLFLKTQNFHWNVTGPNFKSLHQMFEEQYNDLFAAIDLIAERIRAIGDKAPGSFSEYNNLTNINEAEAEISASVMVKELANDQKIIINTLLSSLKEAQNIGDEVTAGIVTDRIEVHEKNAWMLNSSL